MTTPTVNLPHTRREHLPEGCVALAELEYLVDTGRIQHVILAGTPMVSLDAIRDHLRRHQVLCATIDLQPLLP